MKTNEGKRLLDLLNSTLYSSANIVEIEGFFKRVSCYKIIDEKNSIVSLNDNEIEDFFAQKKMSEDDKEKKKKIGRRRN